MTYYMHDSTAAFRFEIAGVISADDAVELQRAWRTASSVIDGRILIVDISYVTEISDGARVLLREWNHNGARVVANSPTARALAESIVGVPLPVTSSPQPATYRPFFTHIAAILAIALWILLDPVGVSASPLPKSGQCAGLRTD